MGVLPRLALCYLAAALIYRGLAGLPQRQRALAALGAASACLLGYWALLMLVAPPGGVAGDLSPSGNLGAWLDRLLLGEAHLWRSSRTWDPEGLLSTMPAIGTAMLGVTAGVALDVPRPSSRRAALLVGAGTLVMVLGLLWDAAFPINKNLWTSSYAAFTGGLAALLLGLAYAACDVAGHRRGTHPLVVLGVNALTLFVVSGWLVKTLLLVRIPSPDGSGLTAYAWLYETAFAPWGTPENTSLAFALAMLAVLYLLCAWLYRRGWWIRA
jgi:predicted acyltransferase